MINIASTTTKDIKLGPSKVSKIYQGSNLIYNVDYSKIPLTFEVLTPGTIGFKQYGSVQKDVNYRINGGSWNTLLSNTSGNYITGLKAGDTIEFKGSNIRYATSKSEYCGFEGGTATYNIYGNIMSLSNPQNKSLDQLTTSQTYQFCSMFKKSKAISAKNLILPPLTLAEGCYRALFSLAPILVEPPKILPATTLATYCYWYMFEACPITVAPELPALTVSQQGYGYMFTQCSSLNYIKCMATNISATQATTSWVNKIASKGTFVKNSSMNSWETGVNGIPSGWTVVNA